MSEKKIIAAILVIIGILLIIKPIAVNEKNGEEIIKNWLFSYYHITNYIDVSNEKVYQTKDIDAIITLKNGEKRTIEIKTDTTDTGNLFYETISNEKHNTLGCLEKTEADIVLYLFLKTDELFILKMPDFRIWFHHVLSNEEIVKTEKRIKNKNRDGSIYYSLGYPVSKKAIQSHPFCVVKKNIKNIP